MDEIIIRKMEEQDLPRVGEIFVYAREFMKRTGNPNQWGDYWPEKSVSSDDIKNGTGYVMEDKGRVFATFAFILGADPTYLHIEKFDFYREYKKGSMLEKYGLPDENLSLPDIINLCPKEGQWLNNEPYGTIHRLAGDGSHKGIFEKCLEFCGSQTCNIRADTHIDNKILQHKFIKNGFNPCGVIFVREHLPRIAFHKVMK